MAKRLEKVKAKRAQEIEKQLQQQDAGYVEDFITKQTAPKAVELEPVEELQRRQHGTLGSRDNIP